ncbi:MAG: nickel pincer cofactor biosynthesis protein LarC [Oscillospiraceae bacterium]|nr:nickel pincer cofactor biosynthesis protein LarC [Oscillospiraceae bacterium]
MKTLYFECGMGAAGDMLMAALLELHDTPDDFIQRLGEIGIPDVTVNAKPSVKCGITGTHVTVKVGGREEASHDQHHGDDHNHGHHHEHDHGHSHNHHKHSHEHNDHAHTHSHNHDTHEHSHEHDDHSHGSYSNIEHMINHLNVSDNVKKNALGVYKLLAEAESRAHGVPVNQIHFHEVGEMDAVTDIVGVCMLIEELAPEKILCSAINVGSGYVRCSHGILPVPAPATATILKGVPTYSDQIKGELCTPTGAAILKHFARDYCTMPMLTVSGIGYGMGKKDFAKANCVRAFIGESIDTDGINESVVELVCNLDDMTAEAIAYAQQLLLDEGALDVYTTPIGMKKGRAGLSFTCMCHTSDKDKMLPLIFKHTTTLGIREYVNRRYVLQKKHSEVQSKFGAVKVKTSYGFGVEKSKPEYEDIARIARENNISINEVLETLNTK